MDMTPKNDYYCVAFHINKTRITKDMQTKDEYHLVAYQAASKNKQKILLNA